MPQAAESLASDSLLAPPGAAQAAPSTPLLHGIRAANLEVDVKTPACAGVFNLAEWTGLEPATPGVTGRYSNQLNYHS